MTNDFSPRLVDFPGKSTLFCDLGEACVVDARLRDVHRVILQVIKDDGTTNTSLRRSFHSELSQSDASGYLLELLSPKK